MLFGYALATLMVIVVQKLIFKEREKYMKIMLGTAVVLAISWSFAAYAVQDNVIAPPDVQLIDFMNVNMATGQVVQNLDTVSIGGEYGLSHDISLFANYFDAKDGKGYRDKYSGRAHFTMLSEQQDGALNVDSNGILSFQILQNTNRITQVPVIRVSGPTGSQDFAFKSNGSYVTRYSDVDFSSNAYTYVPIGDKRHSLKRRTNGGWVWRNPEGLEITYSGGGIDSIAYPNGFTVYVDYRAVWTNTGYMLKYDISGTYHNPILNGYWSGNPKSISGVNLAHTYCPTNSSCNTSGWPIASFNWPTGTPASFYLEGIQKIFSVTDQYGAKTDYHYETQNVCKWRLADESGTSSYCLNNNPGDRRLAPRLVGVKSAHSNIIDITYQYENDGAMLVSSPGAGLGMRLLQFYWKLSTKNGRLLKATNKTHWRTYGKPFSSGPYNHSTVRENSGNRVQVYNFHPGKLERVTLRKQGTFEYEYNSRNFVTSLTPLSGPTQFFKYDDDEGGRGNLIRIVVNNRNIREADYATSCTDLNFRYCNKPLWIKDAKGHRTDFTYHAPSGQVATVTGPAVAVNRGTSVRQKTYYTYEQKYAYFKNAGGSIVRAGAPLWLLTKEHTCRTSQATLTGCPNGSADMVETRYYYGPQQTGVANNLHMRGKSVTAQGGTGTIETRVWCYAYDKLGKLIKETPPKGNGASVEACE